MKLARIISWPVFIAVSGVVFELVAWQVAPILAEIFG
jgi:hypothetical protein